jgi:hypothetical protein
MSNIVPTDCHSLLTIYRDDLDTTLPSTTDDLVLFQLPPSIHLSDLPSSRLIATTPTQQACWINEAKGVSYAVSRVETSNAYVMIKPTGERPNKKMKRSMNMLQVQLLQRGGSGASFLELKEHTLDLNAMHSMLKQHVFDPFDVKCDWKGLSVEELSIRLQVSEKEAIAGLTKVGGLMLSNRYGHLSEEGLAEAQDSIVATLTEVERFHELVNIDVEDCIRQVMSRTEEHYEHLHGVIRHTLQKLRSGSDEKNSDDVNFSLDVTKVAQCVAHRLFRKQGTWETGRLMAEWQLQMPGVRHEVNLTMLRGIAIARPKEQWVYAANMPIQERLEYLFAIKDGWSKTDLAPHMSGSDDWTKYCSLRTSLEGEQLYHFNGSRGEV